MILRKFFNWDCPADLSPSLNAFSLPAPLPKWPQGMYFFWLNYYGE